MSSSFCYGEIFAIINVFIGVILAAERTYRRFERHIEKRDSMVPTYHQELPQPEREMQPLPPSCSTITPASLTLPTHRRVTPTTSGLGKITIDAPPPDLSRKD